MRSHAGLRSQVEVAQAGLLTLFMLRILFAQAYYIVTYALGIYLLSVSALMLPRRC